MIEKDKRYIYTLAFFYSMMIILVVSIPAWFYISVEKKSYRQNQMQNLEHYAYSVQKSIYDFSRTQGHVFDFPRSLFYSAALYAPDGKRIFTTDTATDTIDSDRYISKKILLNSNRLGADSLLVFQRFSYKEIYTRALISALFLGAVIFLMTLFFVKISLRPLEQLNRYLRTFFNDAMHELKTPLGVMQLNLETLRNREESKVLRRLYNSMQSMILIYEDIEYHIKHTHVDYQSEKIDASYFLRNRVEVFRDLAKVKEIVIEEEIAGDITLMINRIELQRIIDNTLSNAIKYSEKRRKIFVRLFRKDAKTVLSIEDQGVGIKNVKKIFERYRREDTVKGGFGIGLSIVKHICDKNHIEISVTTSPQKGSTFTYTFPQSK